MEAVRGKSKSKNRVKSKRKSKGNSEGKGKGKGKDKNKGNGKGSGRGRPLYNLHLIVNNTFGSLFLVPEGLIDGATSGCFLAEVTDDVGARILLPNTRIKPFIIGEPFAGVSSNRPIQNSSKQSSPVQE
ncbi:MAG: hypothetical protein WA718_02355 [Terriglobales bacterium]